jgi:hypothetical protein
MKESENLKLIQTRKNELIILIIIVIILVASIFYYYKPVSNNTITYNEFLLDYTETSNGSNYESYDHGDTVHIKDKIHFISSSGNYSFIQFESTGNALGSILQLRGNLTDEYHIGETVIVTLHIYEVENNGILYELYPVLTSDDIKHA